MAAMMVKNRKRISTGGTRFQGHITLIADFQTIASNTAAAVACVSNMSSWILRPCSVVDCFHLDAAKQLEVLFRLRIATTRGLVQCGLLWEIAKAETTLENARDVAKKQSASRSQRQASKKR
jgi:hypothetical protein